MECLKGVFTAVDHQWLLFCALLFSFFLAWCFFFKSLLLMFLGGGGGQRGAAADVSAAVCGCVVLRHY